MKTRMIRAAVVTFALAAFGFLAISPTRAQTSTSNTTNPMGGCCGSTSTSNTSH